MSFVSRARAQLVGARRLGPFATGVRDSTRTLFKLLSAAWREYHNDYAGYLAAAMVYYALVSLVPLLLLLLAAVGLLLRFSDVALSLEQQVLHAIEAGFGTELRSSVTLVLERLQQQSPAASFISLIGLLLTSAALAGHLRMSFRAIWQQGPPLTSGSLRGAISGSLREKAIAFTIVIVGGALMLGALVALVVLEWLSGFAGNIPVLGPKARWLLALPGSQVVVPITFALLFMFLPPVRLPWRHVWLAAALCSAGWLIGVQALALYGAFFSKNVSAYGAIGGLLAVMLWLKFVSQILFYGGELCKVVSRSTSG